MTGIVATHPHPERFRTRLAALSGILASEVQTQFRSGLSALYIGMPLLWILIARLLPPASRPMIVLIGAYTDPITMGQIFTGAFLARERDQGLLEAWAVTPLGAGMWLAIRIFMIGIQGSIGGVLLALGSGVAFKPALLILGVFLAAASGALIGLIIARPFRDILSYFVLGGITSALVSLPIAGYLLKPSWYWLIPGPAASGWSVLSAALGVTGRIQGGHPYLGLIPLALWTLLLFIFARHVFHRAFFRRPGEGAKA